MLPTAKHDADRRGGEAELPDRVDEQDREDEVAEEVGERDRCDHAALVGVGEDVAQALAELCLHRAPLLARRRLLGLLDQAEQERREEEADRVGEDRDRSGQDRDEHAGEPGPADVRGRAADLELRVAVDDLLSPDERREVRLVRDVEEDGADPVRRSATA